MPRANSTVKSMKWWLRCTASHEHLLAFYQKVMKGWIDFSGGMCAFHHGDKEEPNPHVHIAFILKHELQQQSVLDRVKKATGCNANNIFLKAWDGDEQVLRYCFHEQVEGKNSEVLNDLGLTAQQIQRLKDESAMINAEVKEQNLKATYKCVEWVLELISASGKRKWDKYEIATAIIRGVWEGKFHDPGDMTLEKHINEIMIKQCENDEDLTEYINERVSRLRMFSNRN